MSTKFTYRQVLRDVHAALKNAIRVFVVNDSSDPIPVTTTTPPTSPTIYNINVLSANTEQSQALPSNTKKILIRVRGNANLKFSFTATQSGVSYISVPRGSSYSESGLNASSQTIFFQTDQPSQVVELLVWG